MGTCSIDITAIIVALYCISCNPFKLICAIFVFFLSKIKYHKYKMKERSNGQHKKCKAVKKELTTPVQSTLKKKKTIFLKTKTFVRRGIINDKELLGIPGRMCVFGSRKLMDKNSLHLHTSV